MRDGLSRRRIGCDPNQFLDTLAKSIRSEWTLEDVLRTVLDRVLFWCFSTISGHQDEKRCRPQTCASTKLGDGVLNFEIGENGVDDDDGRFKGSATIDSVIHVAGNFEMKIGACERFAQVFHVTRFIFDN